MRAALPKEKKNFNLSLSLSLPLNDSNGKWCIVRERRRKHIWQQPTKHKSHHWQNALCVMPQLTEPISCWATTLRSRCIGQPYLYLIFIYIYIYPVFFSCIVSRSSAGLFFFFFFAATISVLERLPGEKAAA